MIVNINNGKLALVLGVSIAAVGLIIYLDNRGKKKKPIIQAPPAVSEGEIRAELEKLVSRLLQQSPIDPFYRLQPDLSKLDKTELAELKLAMETINKQRGERDVMKYAAQALDTAQYLISKAK